MPMRPRPVAFTCLLIVLGQLLSGIVLQVPTATDAGQVSSIASHAGIAVAKADQPQRKAKQRHRPRVRTSAAPTRSEPRGSQSASGPCAGLELIVLPGEDGCTHGPDPAPPGFDEDVPVARMSVAAANAEVAAIACEGDGQSGNRTQVLYVRDSNVTSRYAQMLPSIRGWAGAADQIIRTSAAETGGERAIRFVHDAQCLPTVPEVVVSSEAASNFTTMISELRNQGYNRSDRMYMIFADATNYCGIGTMKSDDRPGSANRNNVGPGYARVDAGCWGGSTAAHELMHNLGGVQDSAPNSSLGGHCIDEYDVMCYSDSPFHPQMRYDCSDRTPRMDCGHQDYFHTNPHPDSYLASHWNTASNRFLIAGGNGPVDPNPDPAPPPGVSTAPPPPSDSDATDNHKKDKKHKGGKKGKGKHRHHH
jgi:hypothetical protein